MNTVLYFYDGLAARSARQQRQELLASVGKSVVRAPIRLIQWGIDDFRRYRHPERW